MSSFDTRYYVFCDVFSTGLGSSSLQSVDGNEINCSRVILDVCNFGVGCESLEYRKPSPSEGPHWRPNPQAAAAASDWGQDSLSLQRTRRTSVGFPKSLELLPDSVEARDTDFERLKGDSVSKSIQSHKIHRFSVLRFLCVVQKTRQGLHP